MTNAAGMIRFARGDAGYPPALYTRLRDAAPPALTVRGEPANLEMKLLALFCSIRTPPDLVLPAYDLARRLRDSGAPVISGFQSPVETDCLDLLLQGEQPLVVVAARGIESMQIPGAWRLPMEGDRLAVVSAHPAKLRRPTARSSEERNRVVAAAADSVFMVSATPAGRLDALAREVVARGQRLSCFDHPANEDLLLLGAEPVDPRTPPL